MPVRRSASARKVVPPRGVPQMKYEQRVSMPICRLSGCDSSGAASRLALPLEDVLVAAVAAGAGRHPDERVPAIPEEGEYLLRLCYLERVAADPVDEIVPDGHAAH